MILYDLLCFPSSWYLVFGLICILGVFCYSQIPRQGTHVQHPYERAVNRKVQPYGVVLQCKNRMPHTGSRDICLATDMRLLVRLGQDLHVSVSDPALRYSRWISKPSASARATTAGTAWRSEK